MKANAYGHGMVRIARKAIHAGVDWLAVSTVEEGEILRQEGINIPIMILGGIFKEEINLMIKNKLTPTISDLSTAEDLSQIASIHSKKVDIHVKIDTGMGRWGFSWKESLECIRKINGMPYVEITGICSHFATADEERRAFAIEQMDKFNNLISLLEKEDIFIPLKHIANSAGIIELEDSHYEMVRPGIILYGIYPSKHVNRDMGIIPVMSWKTRVGLLKSVPRGSTLSYGRTYVVSRDSVIGVIPVGYGDGLSRGLSNRGEVLIKGKKAPIVGTVCMDSCMIDVTGIPGVSRDDEVVIMGKQGNQQISAEDISEKLNTIPYEILCQVTGRVNRIYKGEGADD